VRQSRFREDLYYRLAMVELRVPALRDRPEDIPLLVRHLGERLAARTGFPEPRCPPETLEALRERRWPGNVRELESVLARALVQSGGGPILPRHLDPAGGPPEFFADGDGGSLEQEMIEAALRRSNGVVKTAADRIGWTRQKLRRRMVALGITRVGIRD
jgi:DNA-binding NtrC family response regulator